MTLSHPSPSKYAGEAPAPGREAAPRQGHLTSPNGKPETGPGHEEGHLGRDRQSTTCREANQTPGDADASPALPDEVTCPNEH